MFWMVKEHVEKTSVDRELSRNTGDITWMNKWWKLTAVKVLISNGLLNVNVSLLMRKLSRFLRRILEFKLWNVKN